MSEVRSRVVSMGQVAARDGILSPSEYLPDVRVGSDFVSIYDKNGSEVVHWVEDEWVEDPTVVPSIANAIMLAYERGVGYLKEQVKP